MTFEARLTGGRGIYFLLFCVVKRGESNKEEKNESRGIPIFPLDNPLLKTARGGLRPPIWIPPRERPHGNIP